MTIAALAAACAGEDTSDALVTSDGVSIPPELSSWNSNPAIQGLSEAQLVADLDALGLNLGDLVQVETLSLLSTDGQPAEFQVLRVSSDFDGSNCSSRGISDVLIVLDEQPPPNIAEPLVILGLSSVTRINVPTDLVMTGLSEDVDRASLPTEFAFRLLQPPQGPLVLLAGNVSLDAEILLTAAGFAGSQFCGGNGRFPELRQAWIDGSTSMGPLDAAPVVSRAR